MEKVFVKIVNKSENALPSYQSDAASGVDLYANLVSPDPGQHVKYKGRDFNALIKESGEVEIHLFPKGRILIPTGIHVDIPAGYEGQVRPRSGRALKEGLTIPNSPGTIDSDYRGDVGVILLNNSTETVVIKHGERIAQLVFTRVAKANFEVVEELSTTVRGEGGFGHTGK